ncbi:hypothetical protein [Pseudomonas sp. dw_612]|uniref:hypothetical protein n=1 Tax=Pseudomonas sp. dw_612 TaxID=2720080 RepID=UPI002115FAC0|nr:hypothetical protein [Pseudomonas sp. dw_612]
MTRALNKNKKPETNNKNRACNYFLGSFGSPCSFWRLSHLRRVAADEHREAAFGREAPANWLTAFILTHRNLWFYDGFAAERGRALLVSCDIGHIPRRPDIPFKPFRSFLHHPPTKC